MVRLLMRKDLFLRRQHAEITKKDGKGMNLKSSLNESYLCLFCDF